MNASNQPMCKFSFKSVINMNKDFEDESSGDSADSQSHRHLEKYTLDEYFPPGYKERMEKEGGEEVEGIMEDFFESYYEGIYKNGDLPSQDHVLCVQIGEGGPVFDAVRQVNKLNFLSELHELSDSRVLERLPIIYK